MVFKRFPIVFFSLVIQILNSFKKACQEIESVRYTFTQQIDPLFFFLRKDTTPIFLTKHSVHLILFASDQLNQIRM